MQILKLHPDLLHQKPWGWDPGIWVLAAFWVSLMPVSLRSTAVDLSLSDVAPLVAYLAQWASVLSRPELKLLIMQLQLACSDGKCSLYLALFPPNLPCLVFKSPDLE